MGSAGDVWYDREKAPRLYEGWRAMLEKLGEGSQPYLEVLLAGMETGLSAVTVRNMIIDARKKKGWMYQSGSRKQDTVTLRLTQAGIERLRNE